MLTDLRYAVRLIRNAPVASLVAVLTLAIGVGANTAIFSIIRAVLLEPLPFAHADRIVQINERWPTIPGPRPVSSLNYADWIAQSDVFERIAAVSWGSTTIDAGDQPFWTEGSFVSPSYFEVFGARAQIGRTFAPDDDEPGRDRVVVLSHRLWTSKLGGDPAIVGSTVRLDGEPYTVIGVMPAGLALHFYDTPIWRPLPRHWGTVRAARDLRTVEARLKPGVTVPQARAQLTAIADRLALQYPDANKGYGVSLEAFPRPIGLDVEPSLYLLFAAVGMVLLIACVNLANLAIVRGASRAREVAIRAALGATRAQIARQFLTEHLLVASIGGVAGVAVGALVLNVLIPSIPTSGLRAAYPEGTAIVVDRAVWAFGLSLSVLSGVAFGLAPALGAARRSLVETIRDGTPGVSAGPGRRRMRQALVVVEVALAVVLLTGAALLIQSFFALARRIDTGFSGRNVLAASLPMSPKRFESGDALNRYLDQIGARVKALPGVGDVAFADAVPPEGFPYGKLFQIVGEPTVPYASRPLCGFKVVSASYFRTLGLRITRGRPLTDDDRAGSPLAIVINQTMARAFFADSNPIGRQVVIRRAPLREADPAPDEAWTIVGVVADEGISPFERAEQAAAYATREQHPRRNLDLVVRALASPSTLEEPIRRSVAAVDRQQAVADVKTIEDRETEDVAPDRLRSILLTAFAAIACVLTALGIYGVMAFGVVQRTRELGIRAALGARASNLLRLVLGDAVAHIALGLAIGVAAALAASRVIAAFLVGITPWDPLTLAGVGIFLAIVAAAACYLPARQAVKVDPLVALKSE